MTQSAEQRREQTPIDKIAETYLAKATDLTPELRVYLGTEGAKSEYSDLSPDGVTAGRQLLSETAAELESEEPLDDIDWVTKTDLLRELRLEQEVIDAEWHQRDLNNLESPAQRTREIFDLMPTSSEQDWADIAARMQNLPAALDGWRETLRTGIRAKNTPARRQVENVLDQLRQFDDGKGYFHDLAESAEVPDSLRKELRAGAETATSAQHDLAAFFRDELLPHAREEDAVGRELYSLMSRRFLGAVVDLDETYEWGIEELERMKSEQERIAGEIKPGATVQEAIEHLDRDSSRKIHGTDALKAWMQRTSDEAVEELGRVHFDIAEPIKDLECMIAPSQTGAIYYTPPADDFSRPGRMWWSVPEGITEFDTWRELTTVYHEGVPGHHLQLAQAVYNKDSLNSWRRIAGTSGHAEGWALYAERLMESLGYLDDPADRLGMLDGQRMRAARVVLDIGVHLGKPRLDGTGTWDFDYAFEFMKSNVNMNEPFVRFEVNRYFGWPGQAPSYKIGQRIFEQLRDEAEEMAGAAFDPKEFHMRVLNIGGVGLDTLRAAVKRG
ncbi:DUF885 domain-containing protein [uncultured Agrococcus sp.]|uniref:DUF885 domain-containing protein n=1 Tax=uncultured Agrococcus sp. TaxID=382258 RepID=UPI0025F572C9|nr:DUF885 domain-containing protein [uncultured Agrococcus sp.]